LPIFPQNFSVNFLEYNPLPIRTSSSEFNGSFPEGRTIYREERRESNQKLPDQPEDQPEYSQVLSYAFLKLEKE
jgi:hypothetical protein